MHWQHKNLRMSDDARWRQFKIQGFVYRIAQRQSLRIWVDHVSLTYLTDLDVGIFVVVRIRVGVCETAISRSLSVTRSLTSVCFSTFNLGLVGSRRSGDSPQPLPDHVLCRSRRRSI